MKLKVYVASSWRNTYYDTVLKALREAGHLTWDWRNPPTGGGGFKWQQAGLETYEHGDKLEAHQWRRLLDHPIAVAGYASDLCGMNWADVGVLLHPCGRSAHLEAGWMAGRGKVVHVLAQEAVEPDLMVLALNGAILGNIDALISRLSS